ncbi:MAG: PHB depolymerase family esterase [Chloroflexota bacterium]
MYRLFCTLIAVLLLGVVTTAQESAPATHPYNPLTITHDGIERTAHIYDADNDTTNNTALIALHPFFSSARAMEAISDLNQLADERGWMIIYPEAIHDYWDDGRVENGLSPNDGIVDDVGYLNTLVTTLRADHNIDTVYITGFGLGGTMAMRAVCESPTTYDGIAVVGALMWEYQQAYCEDLADATNSIDVLFMIGNQDHRFWYEGREIAFAENPQRIMGAIETVNFWGERRLCGDTSDIGERYSTLVLYENCTGGSQVAFLTVLTGGSAWFRNDDNSLNRTGIDATALIGAFFERDTDWVTLTNQETLSTALARSFALYVPTTYDATTPTPVILSLHGRGANSFGQAFTTQFNQLAEQYGFIVVYPQAYDPYYDNPEVADAVWNYNLGTPIETLTWDDDVFLDRLIDDLALDLNIDMSRLYVNGLSNGGYMTNRLACTRSDRYATFASVAATAPYGLTDLCENGNPAPIMFYHGTADDISPWHGLPMTNPATGQRFYAIAPMPNTLGFWLTHNGCGEAYEQRDIPSEDTGSSVSYLTYTDCPADGGIEIYVVIDGGHVWHGVNDFESDLLGEVNMDVNASEAVWAFSSAYTLDGYDADLAIEFDIFGDENTSD